MSRFRRGAYAEPGETLRPDIAAKKAPPIGARAREIKTIQDAREYVRAAEHQASLLEQQKVDAQAKADTLVKEEWSNISTVVRKVEGDPGVYLYKDPSKGKYTADSFRKFQQDTNEFVERADDSIARLQENIVSVNRAIESAQSVKLPSAVATTTTIWTVTHPVTGKQTQFTDEAKKNVFVLNLRKDLDRAIGEVRGAYTLERQRGGEYATRTPQHVAITEMISRGLVTWEVGDEDKMKYRLKDSVFHLSEPDLKLAEKAGFDIKIGERQPAPWTAKNERQLEETFRNSIGLSGGTTIGDFERVGLNLAQTSRDITFNPVANNPTLEWVGQQLIEGGIKSVPIWVGGRLAMAIVGSTGMIVVPLWQYLTGIAAGAPLVPQVDFVVPKDVYARNQQLKAQLKEHPELFLEVALEGVGGLLTMGGLEVGLSKIQQSRINKIYGDLQPEDFYVDEEILMQYPEDVSYQQIIHETIYQPISTHLVTHDVVNPASLIRAGYKEGMFYKIGNEYGIVMTGEGAVAVKITPGMDTTPTTVFKPIDITNVINIIKHKPGIILDLNKLTSQGIQLPAWLAGAGVNVSVLSNNDLMNTSLIGNEIILDQEGNVYYRTTEKTDMWSDQTIEQRQVINIETVLDDVLSETSKFQSIEIPSVEIVEEFVPGIELSVDEISDIEPLKETPIVVPEISLDIPPIPIIEVPPIIIEEPVPEETPIPIDPIERQVETLRRKMIREGTPGVGKATRQLRTKLLKQKRIEEEKRRIKPSKSLEPYLVLFSYPTGASETEWVDAKTFHHALNIAQRRRKIKLVPNDVLVEHRPLGPQ